MSLPVNVGHAFNENHNSRYDVLRKQEKDKQFCWQLKIISAKQAHINHHRGGNGVDRGQGTSPEILQTRQAHALKLVNVFIGK